MAFTQELFLESACSAESIGIFSLQNTTNILLLEEVDVYGKIKFNIIVLCLTELFKGSYLCMWMAESDFNACGENCRVFNRAQRL